MIDLITLKMSFKEYVRIKYIGCCSWEMLATKIP